MSYATVEDMIARMEEMGVEFSADPSMMLAALADASEEIDERLSSRYITPVDPTPNAIKRWCVELAISLFCTINKLAVPCHFGESIKNIRRALGAIECGLAGIRDAKESAKP